MKILLLLALAAAPPLPSVPLPSIDGLPLAALGRQSLPQRGCAAYLFTTGQTRALAAMASGDPATLRLAIDGTPADYPRVAADGVGPYGFPAEARYTARGITLTLALTIEERTNLTAGALVPAATLTIERPGQDVLVVPLAGMIGCKT